eukprot:GEMP01011195.1.p1 GENE.GEMP01011195.1~~GEMP01011195.1.p1  ORF type:complete len:440 (+),score=93.15 GEMP01011195.1:337-1656(+)
MVASNDETSQSAYEAYNVYCPASPALTPFDPDAEMDYELDTDPDADAASSSSRSREPMSPVKRRRLQYPAPPSPYRSPIDPQCPICLESIACLDEVHTPCGHIFCAQCLRTVLATDGAATRRIAPSGRRGRYRHWLSIQEEGGMLKCPCCRRNAFPRQIVFIATQEPLFHPWSLANNQSSSEVLSPIVTTIYGQTYVQVGGIGLASYHFESEDNAYLSYERAPDDWLLDDGTKPPERKTFVDAHYDPDTRTFTGTVIWPVPFNGHGKWDYEMVFSKDFMIIERGGVSLRDLHDPTSVADRLLYEDHLFYENDVVVLNDIFGQTYVQGRREVGVASYHFNSLVDSYISYEYAPVTWVLDNGLAPPANVPFVNTSYDATTRTFSGTIEWEIPFFGDSRWEYTMVFSEDFGVITEGRCVAYDTADHCARVWLFERDLYYHIL